MAPHSDRRGTVVGTQQGTSSTPVSTLFDFKKRRTWARVVLSMLKRREAGGLGGSSLPMVPWNSQLPRRCAPTSFCC